MMKYLMWLLKAALFFVLFAFALNNQAPVTLHLFFGNHWQAPLVLVLLSVLLLGLLLGILLMLPLWLGARSARAQAASAAQAQRKQEPAADQATDVPLAPYGL